MSSFNIDDVAAALENTRVSPSGVSFEGKSLKLDTEDDAKPVVEAISKCTNLQYLNLEGNTLGVDASKAIAKALETHPEFKRAQWKDMFTGRMKNEIPKSLKFLGDGLVTAKARLTELDLSDNAFGPIGVEGLASLLRSSSCYALEELRLNNNGLGITGGKLLASALLDCYNSSKNEGKPLALKVFIAGRNRLENEGAKALAEVFKTIGTLEEVAMPQNGIYHIGISALSSAFMENQNLQILNLNDNTIGCKGAKALADVLPNLKNLKVINFGDCLLKTKGAQYIAEGLTDNVKLEELILGFNEIRTAGAIMLIQAIANKTKLKSLVLDGNQFGEEGKSKIKNNLKEIGKLNILESLDEDESNDEDEEEDESGEEDSDKEQSEEDSDHEQEAVHDNDTNIKHQSINLDDFLNSPNVENFTLLKEELGHLVIEKVRANTDMYIETIVPIIMKICSLSTHTSISKQVFSCSEFLYRNLFAWALQNDKQSLVNNSLLVHLGLIKSEDKNLKLAWNVEACILALENLFNQNYVPDSTKDVLKVFLGRDIDKKPELSSAKKKILTLIKETQDTTE